MRAIVTLAALLAATGTASAAEIKALITTAMEAAIVVLVPPFERATGHKVTVSYDPSGGLARRLRNGEFADMILVASSELDKLIAEGKADIYPRFGPTNEWDTAAGQGVLEAAGGEVVTTDNKPLLYGKKGFGNPHFIARTKEAR